MSDQYYTVGKIANTHGLRGELKIIPQTDFAEERFAKGSKLYIQAKGDRIPVVIAKARPHKHTYIVQLVDYTDINQVEPFKGGTLQVAAEDRAPLPEDEYYYDEIIGCQVISDEDEVLGEVTDILVTGANDVWIVTPPEGKEILLPVIDDVILHVDTHSKKIKVHLLEGLVSS